MAGVRAREPWSSQKNPEQNIGFGYMVCKEYALFNALDMQWELVSGFETYF